MSEEQQDKATPGADDERAARIAAAKAKAQALKAAKAAGEEPVATPPERKVPPKKKAEEPLQPETPEAWQGYERKILAALPDLERDAATVGALGFRVPPAKLHDTVATLRHLEGIATDYLSSVSAVDWKDAFEVVYHLFSLADAQVRLVLKVRLEREAAEVASITDLFPGANWQEREVYDLFGIRFHGHPDLRRILMPEHFTGGHPLRKDYQDQRPKRERKVRPR